MEGMIKKARKGDGEAFTRLMQAHMQDMYKTAWAILRNDEDAADAVSDTILACWEKLYQLKQDRYFKTWMIRILINNCNAILQKKRGIADPGTSEEKERFLEIPYVEKGVPGSGMAGGIKRHRGKIPAGAASVLYATTCKLL